MTASPAFPLNLDRSPLLEVRDVVKGFPGVRALRGVSLSLSPGEVVAVIGENGAGKSTLMKILAGIQTPDSGEIWVDGRPVTLDSVRAASLAGVALIHQELNLADNLSVAANIYLGREPQSLGFVRWRQLEADAVRHLDRVALRVPPTTKVARLSIGQQQMVEIAKALSTDARVLIMDEPTSSLSAHETEQLFRVVKDLRDRGVCVLYISHRLGEVKELADRAIVLRDGQKVGELVRDEITHDRMVRMMVGRDLSQFYPHTPRPPGPVTLEVRELRTEAFPAHALSFTVGAGEIVGVAGLVGAGRTEMLRTLFGVDRPVGGTILVGGVEVAPRTPVEAIRAGLALVPEDRKQQGLVVDMPVRENLSLARLRRDAKAGLLGWLNRAAERVLSTQMIEALRIKTPGDRQRVQYLSGGNQQKIVIGKWLAMRPRVLLLDEPTRGIDVGAKAEIYALMERLADDGVAILFVSSEMEEILGMSDRALVIHEGRLTGELARDALSEEAVMSLATGREGGDAFRAA